MVKNPETKTAQLIERIAPLVEPLGYEIVHLEVQIGRGRTLRLFIDRLNSDTRIGIEDCVKVTKALDEPLETLPELEEVFNGAPYELEVSSPGVDRPLRTARDFERFAGREARIHVYRPLTAEELGNSAYAAKNPKQKNFIGTLRGFREERVLLVVEPSGSVAKERGKSGKKKSEKTGNGKDLPVGSGTKSAEEVSIPLPLISKANLEPSFEPLEKNASS